MPESSLHSLGRADGPSPFDPDNLQAYQRWRDEKQAALRPSLSDLMLEITDPARLSASEIAGLRDRCQRYNMVLYSLADNSEQPKSLVHDLGRQLGMSRLDANIRSDEDSVSSLEVRSQAGNQYIPYTNKALSWHTDGYYNNLDKQIYAFILHCVSPAEEGGVNRLLDHEALYIALRDENPAYIEALMHPEAMTIPDNIEAGKVIRGAITGPVFSVIPESGRLHMRFSARKRNIAWRDTEETREAVELINRYMADDNNVVKATLQAGQGVICNNVLHNRSSFTDSVDQKRLMYRARYYDAVA